MSVLKKRCFEVVSFLLVFVATTGFAMNEKALQHWVEAYVQKQMTVAPNDKLDVEVLGFDSNLKSCQSPFIPEMVEDKGQGGGAVKLTCLDEPGFQLFVPIRIHVMTQVLCTNRVVSQGESLSPQNLTYQYRDKNKLQDGYFTDFEALNGVKLARTLQMGTVVTSKMIKHMPVIRKNQLITLVSKRGAIEVSMTGIAKTDGYLNELVKVQNPSTKKMIDAVVVSANRAEVVS